MYNYIKALHIIFVVAWFAGLFYMPRLLVYNTEAGNKPEPARQVLREQFGLMIKRLWYAITWPAAILTLVLGVTEWTLLGILPTWLLIKLFFVAGLYGYHFSLHVIIRQQLKGVFKYSSQQLRMWNEVATIFLVAIVMLAVVKNGMSLAWGLGGFLLFIIILMSAVRIYKIIRTRK
ncbi:MAG TPA: CopD family protein [Chitinophagaceae bacterium]|jgi:putative membrane protein